MKKDKRLAEIWEKNIDRKAAKKRAERVIRLMKKYHPNAKIVLELGVGLGAVLFYFKKFERYGLDLSKEYINIAKKVVSSAELYVQNMDNFKINKKVDVIFSVHECINEVKPFKNWQATFRHTYNHLNEKGLFIFDMRTEKHLEDKKKQIVKLEKTPSGFIYDNTLIKGNKLIWDTTYFNKIKGNIYKIEKDRYSENIFPISKVKKSLQKNFEVLEINLFNKDRIALFVCRKKFSRK